MQGNVEVSGAEVLLAQLSAKMDQLMGGTCHDDGSCPTVAEFMPTFLTESRDVDRQKPSTVATKEYLLRMHILPVAGEVRLTRISDAHIAEIKARLKDRSPKTVNNALSALSKLLKVAKKRRVIRVLPVAIEPVHAELGVVPFYEYADYELIVAAAREEGPRCLAMTLLGGDAGLRAGEMRALEWSDLDFRRGLVTIARAEWYGHITSTKGRKVRRVAMTNALRWALERLKRQSKHARVLVNDDGEPISKQGQHTWMRHVQKRAGLRSNGGLHILRHTFCSHLAMRGAPVVAIQGLAGHTSLRTTMRYMHLAPSEAHRAIALLDAARETKTKQPQNGRSPSETTVKNNLMTLPGFEPELPHRARQRGSPDKAGSGAENLSTLFKRNLHFASVESVANFLGVSASTVYREIHDGPLVAHRRGKRGLRVHKEDLRRYLEQARVR